MPRSTPPLRCAYCLRVATTRDHVPPKAILRKPFPELVTVPACKACNSGWGRIDERFRNVLALLLGDSNTQSSAFWDERVVRGVRRGGAATRLLQPAGVGFSIDARSVDPMLHRLVRGLMYYELGIPLPLYVPIEAHLVLGRSNEAVKLVSESGFFHRRVGDFEYWGGFEDKPYGSRWVFRFFDSIVALGVTGEFVKTLEAVPDRHPKQPVWLKPGTAERLPMGIINLGDSRPLPNYAWLQQIRRTQGSADAPAGLQDKEAVEPSTQEKSPPRP